MRRPFGLDEGKWNACLYAFCDRRGRVKIGYSINLVDRAKTLPRTCGSILCLLGAVSTEYAQDREIAMHAALRAEAKKGERSEWYSLGCPAVDQVLSDILSGRDPLHRFPSPSERPLASAIREVRGYRHPYAMAQEVGCHQTTLTSWERGRFRPRSESHIRFLEAEGVPASLLRAERPVKASTGTAA